MRETKRADLRVDEPEGRRWQVAMDLLEGGLGMVQIHDLLLYRDRGGVRPVEPVVVVEVDAYDWWRQSLEVSERDRRASEQVTRARARIADLVASDERFEMLISRFGIRYDLAVDYGNGAVKVADILDDGSLVWTVSPSPDE